MATAEKPSTANEGILDEPLGKIAQDFGQMPAKNAPQSRELPPFATFEGVLVTFFSQVEKWRAQIFIGRGMTTRMARAEKLIVVKPPVS